MKNLTKIILLLLALIAFKANAQLQGKISSLADTAWTLSNNSGISIEVKGDKSGYFNLNISRLQQGIYNFGQMGEIFLAPAYKTTIDCVDKIYRIKGDGALENNILKDTRKRLHAFLGNSGYDVDFKYLITEPAVFIPMLDEYVQMINIKSEKSNNKFFKDFIKSEAAFSKRYVLYAYSRFYGLDSSRMATLRKLLSIPIAERNENYKKDLMAAYQAQFSKRLSSEEKALLNKSIYTGWDVNDEIFYKNSNYYKTMIGYLIDHLSIQPENQKIRDSIKSGDLIKLKVADNLINNSFIKEYFTYIYSNQAIKKAKQPADVTSIYDSFVKNSKNQKYISEIISSYQNLAATVNNAQAPDFNFISSAGNMVSLKSLKGKYVYIDIWATWCAPCIAQIPELKKLEEKYKNKNIYFVSISVDKKAQKEDWLNFVAKNNLQGIQLMADQDFESDFIKKFGINSIPRFILIDTNGLIVDNNAKRPSDPALAEQLQALKL
ncbi:TlpA disulfide reductase family protein [uncultured Pedobacter sp.]|uniref:TlpA family protein disulfide reductase n=1 Tax=uncultured Pedobacter sp. TaxID=246139 RepID=UPI0025EB63D0|nr:TlpA disulfide reductase family protein [uncultured Pedobacter sp.]